MLNSSIIVNNNVNPVLPLWNHVYSSRARANDLASSLGQGFSVAPVTDFIVTKSNKA